MTTTAMLWQPSPERIAQREHHRVRATRRGARTASTLPDYAALWRWSIDDKRGVLARGLGLRAASSATRGERTLVDARPDARRALVPRRAAQLRREPARAARAPTTRRRARLPRRGQGRAPRCRTPSCRARCRASRRRLRALGRAARATASPRYLPNMPEAIVAMLGAASPRRDLVVVLAGLRRRRACSTASARSSRACSSPSTATGTTASRCRSSTRSPRSSRALPTVERVVVVPYLQQTGGAPDDLAAVRGARRAGTRSLAPLRAGPIAFARLPFDHPLYILYSSGTTGVPKCIVHGAGGTLLQHLKEHLLHGDLQPRRPRCSTSRPAAG